MDELNYNYQILNLLSDRLVRSSTEIYDELKQISSKVSRLNVDMALKSLEKQHYVFAPEIRHYIITDLGTAALENFPTQKISSDDSQHSTEFTSNKNENKQVQQVQTAKHSSRASRLMKLLKEIDHPCHYQDLYCSYVELYEDDTSVTSNRIYSALRSNKRFELLGEGVFGLSHWNNQLYDLSEYIPKVNRTSDQVESRVEILIQILSDAGQPLHYTHIHKIGNSNEMLGNQVNERTIYSTLYASESFNSLGYGCFGLKAWLHFYPLKINKISKTEINNFFETVTRIIQAHDSPVHYLQIHQDLCDQYDWQHPIYFTLSLLRNSPEFKLLKGLYFGLNRWFSNQKKEVFIKILESMQKPMHYSQIYELAQNVDGVDTVALSASNTAATLYSNDEFIGLGNGYYGLSKWKNINTFDIPLPQQTQEKNNRTHRIEQIFIEFKKPLHYKDIQRILAFDYDDETSYQVIYNTLNGSEIFNSYGRGIFELATQDTRFFVQNDEKCFHIIPEPLLHSDHNKYQLLDTIVVANKLLQEQSGILASTFYANMCEWAELPVSLDLISAQEHFDAWYILGLINHIDFKNDNLQVLHAQNKANSVTELRQYTLTSVCRRLNHSTSILKIVQSIFPANRENISHQARLIGGHSLNYLGILLYLEQLQAVIYENSAWRITSLGESLTNISMNYYSDNLPTYYEEDVDIFTSDSDWEDVLGLLD